MNTNVMFSSKTDMWETPQALFEELNKEFHFEIDACATPENAKCPIYYTPEIDALSQEWNGVIWCNPPYGRQIGKWVNKAYYSYRTNNATIVMLLPARTDTQWFHRFIYNKAEIRFIRGRLKFGNCNNPAPFPSMIVIYNSNKGVNE